WVAANWLFALAAQERWSEGVKAAASEPPQPAATRTPVISVVPYAGVAAGYTLLLMMAIASSEAPLALLVIGAIASTVCVVARQVLALRENASLFAEHARQQGEARFSSLVRHLHDVVAVVDANGTIGYISPSVQRLLGQPPIDLHGISTLSLLLPSD